MKKLNYSFRGPSFPEYISVSEKKRKYVKAQQLLLSPQNCLEKLKARFHHLYIFLHKV